MRALDAELQGFAGRILIGFDALVECVQTNLAQDLPANVDAGDAKKVGVLLASLPKDRIPRMLRCNAESGSFSEGYSGRSHGFSR